MAFPSKAASLPASPTSPSSRPPTGSSEQLCLLSSQRNSSVVICMGKDLTCRSLWSESACGKFDCLPTQQNWTCRSGNSSASFSHFRAGRKGFAARELCRRFCLHRHKFRLSDQRLPEAERQGIFRRDLDGTTEVPQLLPTSLYGQLLARVGGAGGQSQQPASANWVCCCSEKGSNALEDSGAGSVGVGLNGDGDEDEEEKHEKPGVKYVLRLLRFYKNEVSPYLPGSCRYVPTCSVYAQEAYQRYGVLKGTVLTMCRLARCNPLGGSGFDPPRWFDEEKPPSL